VGALQQGQDPLAAAETYAALNPTLAGPSSST